MLTAFILLLTYLTVMFLAVSNAEGIATGIAGFLAPVVAQLVKRLTGADGTAALVVTIAVSAVIAIVSLYIAGEVHTFGDVVKQAMAVFGIATVLYKFFTAATTPAKS